MISDDHAGLRKAVAEIFTEAARQRCYVHFLRNALDYLPKKADNDCYFPQIPPQRNSASRI